VVLLLDDMQWADSATRNLLLYVARRWTRADARVMVLLAVQTGSTAAAEELPSWLPQIEREAATTWLDLGALTEMATRDLVNVLAGAGSAAAETQGEVSTESRLGAWLHSASSGKPGSILALLHRLLEAGRVSFHQAGTGGWVLAPGTTWHEPDWHLDVPPVQFRGSNAARLGHRDPPTRDLFLVG
jgi:hypothetical protein